MTLPPREKLTYEELVKILAEQQVEIERTRQLITAIVSQLGFHDYEILKARLDSGILNKKTPYGKLLDLEKQVLSFIAYHEKNPHIEKKVKTYEFDSIDGSAT